MQFAHGSSVELIRSMKKMPTVPEQLWLSAVDPANPYGALLPWPIKSAVIKPSRSVGAHVALANGQLLGWLSKSGKSLFTFFPDDDAAKHRLVGCLGALLANYAIAKMASREGLLIEEIDGQLPAHHPLFRGLLSAGFELAGGGLRLRVERPTFGQKHLPAPSTAMLEQQESTAPQSIEDEIARELDEAGLS
jgi:ATP-dependent helicase Lhr and Lhr-like helicase